MNNNPSASLEQELPAPNVGARLRVARETAGLTQADAASSIDLSLRTHDVGRHREGAASDSHGRTPKAGTAVSNVGQRPASPRVSIY